MAVPGAGTADSLGINDLRTPHDIRAKHELSILKESHATLDADRRALLHAVNLCMKPGGGMREPVAAEELGRNFGRMCSKGQEHVGALPIGSHDFRCRGVSQQLSRPASRSTSMPATPACDDLDARTFDEDIDVSSGGEIGEDLRFTKDEELLAMLSEMAQGSSDEDDASDSVLSQLPAEVRQKDPSANALHHQVNSLHSEVRSQIELKQDLQARLDGELTLIKDRRQRNSQESACLGQRLLDAKTLLSERLQEASETQQELRSRIEYQWRCNEKLRSEMTSGVRNVVARAAELDHELYAHCESQASLVDELQACREIEQNLQAELREERVKTWRQSRDVVIAFFPGCQSGPLSRCQQSPQRRASPMNKSTPAQSSPSEASPALQAVTCSPSSSSTSRPTENSDVPDKHHDELQFELWKERSTWVRARVARSEEQAALERRCWKQGQRIAELSKELALEETARTQLNTQLDDVVTRVSVSEVKLSNIHRVQWLPASSSIECNILDVASRVRQAENLNSTIQAKLMLRTHNATQLDHKKTLHSQELDRLSSIQELLLSEESRLEAITQNAEMTVSAITQLEHDSCSERCALEEATQQLRQRQRTEMSRLSSERRELESVMESNEDLQLEIQRANRWFCWRRQRKSAGDGEFLSDDEAAIDKVAKDTAAHQAAQSSSNRFLRKT